MYVTVYSLTNVNSHGEKNQQPKPTIESNNEVYNRHTNISKCGNNIEQKIAVRYKLKQSKDYNVHGTN